MIARVFLLLVVCLGIAMPARTAFADDPATRAARRHFERGEKLFALGKFDEALDEYQKAFDAKPLPGFLFNIGQCYRNLGDYDQAIFSFKKYLKADPKAGNREKVEQLIDELEEKKERGEGQKLVRKPADKPPDDDSERPPPSSPIYKKWWFWTGVAVAAGAGGYGVYTLTRPSAPSTDLGNIVFSK
jgi:tetratricopeptide (TPR) repeat protein